MKWSHMGGDPAPEGRKLSNPSVKLPISRGIVRPMLALGRKGNVRFSVIPGSPGHLRAVSAGLE
jgi:hypothetical protein